MAWPTDDLTKVHLDSATDDPSQARGELVALIDKAKEIIAGLVSAATANTGVLRDSSGDFSANEITADLLGNATTATNATTAANTSILATVTSSLATSITIASTPTNFSSLSLGTVTVGDIFVLNGGITGVTYGASTSLFEAIIAETGAASIEINGTTTSVGGKLCRINGVSSGSPQSWMSGYLVEVTGAGALTLVIQATSTGQDSTASGVLSAVQLYNA